MGCRCARNGRICIIEGNCTADPDITQMPDQIGKWPKYREVIFEKMRISFLGDIMCEKPLQKELKKGIKISLLI